MSAYTDPQLSPRSSYTVAQNVQRVLNDLNYQNAKFITSGDIVLWALEAQDQAALRTHWYRSSTVVATVSGQAEYNFPFRSIAINDCRYNGLQLFITNENQLDQTFYNWRLMGVGQPLYWYLRGANILGLFPTPSSGGALLQVFYTGIPPVVNDPQDNYYIPPGFDYLIVTYCKLRASEKDAIGQGGPRIPGYRAEWMEGIEQLRIQAMSAAEGEIAAAGENALYGMGGPQPMIFVPPFTSVTG